MRGWCIIGPTPIPSTAHPTYEHVVLTAVVGPMECRSDGHIKNNILVHPTYFKLSLRQVSRSRSSVGGGCVYRRCTIRCWVDLTTNVQNLILVHLNISIYEQNKNLNVFK